MKYNLSVYFLTIYSLLFGLNNVISQDTITIGNATNIHNDMPYNGYYDYSWSSIIYEASELNNSGNLVSVSFFVNNSPSNFTMNNQKIYVRHTAQNHYANAQYDGITGRELVFEGTIIYNGSGWHTIQFDQAFDYNGTDNLEFLFENRDGSWATNFPYFRMTPTGGSNLLSKRDFRDNSFPSSCYNCSRVNERPNIQLVFENCENEFEPVISSSDILLDPWMQATLTLTTIPQQGDFIWQQSSDGITFTDIDGADSAAYVTAPLFSTKHYRLAYTDNGCTVYSNSIQITINENYISTYTIGTGSNSTNNFPFNGYYNYSWASSIYLADEVDNTPGVLSSVSFYVVNNPINYTMKDQKIYARHTSSASYNNGGYPNTSEFELVYEGDLTFNGSGWHEIVLDTPFAYDGVDNIEFLYENHDGHWMTGFPQFQYSVESVTRTKRDFRDGQFPSSCYNCNNVLGRSTIKMNFVPCSTDLITLNSPYSVLVPGESITLNLDTTSIDFDQYQLTWQFSHDEGVTYQDIDESNYTEYTTLPIFEPIDFRVKLSTEFCFFYSDEVTLTLNQDTIATSEIGNGNNLTGRYPFYHYYDYSYSQHIYHADEINSSGELTRIAVNVGYLPAARTYQNQRIYVRHTSESGYANGQPNYPSDTSGFTLVYEGDITYSNTGWKEFEFATAFNYNGSDNLEFRFENHDGTWTNSYPEFLYTAGYAEQRVKRDYRDGQFPYNCTNCAAFNNIMNIKMFFNPCSYDLNVVNLCSADEMEVSAASVDANEFVYNWYCGEKLGEQCWNYGNWKLVSTDTALVNFNPVNYFDNADDFLLFRRSWLPEDENATVAFDNYTNVLLSPSPVANAGQDTTLLEGETVELGSAPVVGYTYSWSPATGLDNPTSANPIANPDSSTIYVLETTKADCIATDTVVVTVILTMTTDAPVVSSTMLDSIPITPENIFDTIYDSYGNIYSLNSLIVPDDGSGSRTFCNAGYFNVVFEPNCGMSPTGTQEEQDRAAVVCQVLSDISDFIISPLTTSGKKVNIRVRNISQGTPNPQTSNVLGSASSFYALPSGAEVYGIADNEIWKTIISGEDSYIGVASPLNALGGGQIHPPINYFHGQMSFNFSNPSINWFTDMNNTYTSFFDLYSVVLHETTHALGFSSLIESTGFSKFGTHLNYFTRYDMFLHDQNGINLIEGSVTGCSLYNFSFNSNLSTDILAPNPSSDTCVNDETVCEDAISYSGSVTVPVYTPNCFELPSSLSHFEDQCHPAGNPHGNNVYFNMSNAQSASAIKRFLQEEEKMVLCDLGYQTNSTYGNNSVVANSFNNYNDACTGIQVAGINDGITSDGAYTFTGTTGTPITITGILSNDYNADAFECLEVILGAGTLNVTSGTTATLVVYTAATPGVNLLRYVPLNDGSGNRGNITYIYVYITDANCTALNCELINNGGFESANKCGPLSASTLSCWENLSGTPDVFMRNGCYSPTQYATSTGTLSSNPPSDSYDGTPNDNFIGIYSQQSAFRYNSEAIQTFLNEPLTPNENYVLSFWAKVNNHDLGIFPSNVPAPVCFASIPEILAPFNFSQNFPTIPNSVMITYPVIVPNDNSWHYFSIPFTFSGTDNHNVLAIYYGELSVSSNVQPYVFIDDVSIQPQLELHDLSTGVLHVSCHGGNNGIAAVLWPPEVDPDDFTYLWDDPLEQTTYYAEGLSAGTYTVLVTAANGCTQEEQVTINQPEPLNDCVDFLFYDCHAFLACDAFNDPDITRFYVRYVMHEEHATPCGGAEEPFNIYTTNLFTPPQSTDCLGWAATAGPAVGMLGNHVDLTNDYGILTGHFEEDRDFSFRLMVEYNNSTTFVQLGDDDCIQIPAPLCNNPPVTLVLDDQEIENTNELETVTSIMNENLEETILSIFPNPTVSEVNILLEGNSGEYDLVVYSATGKRIAAYSSVRKNKAFKINTLNWAQGIYYCRIQEEGNNRVANFTVVH